MSGLGGSLWLVPDPSSQCHRVLQKEIQRLSSDNAWGVGVAHAFSPHMTITSGITDYFLSSAPKVDFPGYGYLHLNEVQIVQPELKVKEVVLGDLFFKRIFIRLERTQSLLSLVNTLRSQFVGESQDSLDEFMSTFDPHISLAYADDFTVADKDKAQLQEYISNFAQSLDLSVFQFIVLMDTRSQASSSRQDAAKNWKASPIRLSM